MRVKRRMAEEKSKVKQNPLISQISKLITQIERFICVIAFHILLITQILKRITQIRRSICVISSHNQRNQSWVLGYWSVPITVGASAERPSPRSLRLTGHLRFLVFGGALLGVIAAGPLAAGAADETTQTTPMTQAAQATPPAASDMISLETDAKVTAKRFRRELDPEQAAAQAKMKRVERTMTGTINAKGTNGIALSFGISGDSEREMWLPFEEGLKLAGYSSLNQVRQGDMVNVTCEHLEDGSELFLKRLALLKRAPEGQP